MMIKKNAIPVFDNRISPLFDVAKEFLIFDVSQGDVINSYTIDTSRFSEQEIISRLRQEGVGIIICSAVSRCIADVIISVGISLIPNIIGDINEVIDAYLNDNLKNEKFVMPGCMGMGMGRHGRKNCKYNKSEKKVKE